MQDQHYIKPMESVENQINNRSELDNIDIYFNEAKNDNNELSRCSKAHHEDNENESTQELEALDKEGAASSPESSPGKSKQKKQKCKGRKSKK